ncbi:MAG: hypothetical protein MAG451_02775 [Anaerolineales bacterium]|nr:hypothetical protein [Anaerolineales bacterium]
MLSLRTTGVLLLGVIGLLLIPVLGLPAEIPHQPAFSQTYGAPAKAQSKLVSPATGTATVTLTATATATAPATATATQTATQTPTPTATVPAGSGRIAGEVAVQGRVGAEGVQIEVDGTPVATTDHTGAFETSEVDSGMHVVRAVLDGYLPSEKADVAVVADQTTLLPAVELRGGDVDGDNKVGLLDLVIVASHYLTSPPGDPRADINQDGEVNLFDLVLVAGNYDQVGPLPWP